MAMHGGKSFGPETPYMYIVTLSPSPSEDGQILCCILWRLVVTPTLLKP
jgi:hypothetical protein